MLIIITPLPLIYTNGTYPAALGRNKGYVPRDKYLARITIHRPLCDGLVD
jgi:hypothetical protein